MRIFILMMFVIMSSGLYGEGINMPNIYDYNVEMITGEEVSMDKYQGKVILIVNTASKCGYTPQYEGLENLYQEYKDRDFVVLGFPANNFMNQEPGSNEDIQNFCRINYGVTFPLFSKISVKGKNIHPLYRFLTSKETNPEFAGQITWNFNKFLISRQGEIIGRFGSKVKPQSRKLVDALQKALDKKRD